MKAKLLGAIKSLTIWFNTIMGIILAMLPTMLEQLPQLEAYIPPHIYRWLMLLVVVGNVLLRFKTSTALQNK